MLRRKMLMLLGSLVGLLLIVAVAAIWLLQGVLGEMNHAAIQDGAILETANTMTDSITQIEIELREIQVGHTRHLDTLLDQIEALKRTTDKFGGQYERPVPMARPTFESIRADLATFQQHVAMLATVEDPGLARIHNAQAIGVSISLRQEILAVARTMREHIASEEHVAIADFRWIVLGLSIVFLIVINVSLLALLRMGQMIVEPVEQLLEGSRRLAHEEFQYRVVVPSKDEFGELAGAYNLLATQLQAGERRKLETLAQAAVTLNHELNNASAIIKLQLKLLEKRSGGNIAMERSLREIHESLARMTHTIEALKHVRRIVLTDYTAETKMLDLEKSIHDS